MKTTNLRVPDRRQLEKKSDGTQAAAGAGFDRFSAISSN
jgi:hypothetical protein